MDRMDNLICGLGGAGGKLTDAILNENKRFQSYFINTSITDIESLSNTDSDLKNYLCISTSNGVGRKRDLGKKLATRNGASIIENLDKYTQSVVWLVAALGGGSGSAELSVILEALQKMKEAEMLDKIINVICILPHLKSPDIILQNTLDTWSEIINNEAVNSLLFVSNDNFSESIETQLDLENYVNQVFAEGFNSLFDMVDYNGVSFDNGNLGNILTDKGCLYFYDLPEECASIHEAMRKAERQSVLAPMFKTKANTELSEDGSRILKCGYMGISMYNENYDINFFNNNYKPLKETYIGDNESKNMFVVSGCLPPFEYIKAIEMELESRRREREIMDDDYLDFSNMVIKRDKYTDKETVPEPFVKKHTQNIPSKKTNTKKKKVLVDNLFNL